MKINLLTYEPHILFQFKVGMKTTSLSSFIGKKPIHLSSSLLVFNCCKTKLQIFHQRSHLHHISHRCVLEHNTEVNASREIKHKTVQSGLLSMRKNGRQLIKIQKSHLLLFIREITLKIISY